MYGCPPPVVPDAVNVMVLPSLEISMRRLTVICPARRVCCSMVFASTRLNESSRGSEPSVG